MEEGLRMGVMYSAKCCVLYKMFAVNRIGLKHKSDLSNIMLTAG